MKNPVEVLRQKEQQMLQVKKEVDALRITIPLIDVESEKRPETGGDSSAVIEMP
jgi:hypothetical protein